MTRWQRGSTQVSGACCLPIRIGWSGDGACRPHGLLGTANQTTKADKGISKKTLKAMGVRQEGRGPCKEKTLTGGGNETLISRGLAP